MPKVSDFKVGRVLWRAVNVSINGLSLETSIIHPDIGQR
jgi:hypothetical protein